MTKVRAIVVPGVVRFRRPGRRLGDRFRPADPEADLAPHGGGGHFGAGPGCAVGVVDGGSGAGALS